MAYSMTRLWAGLALAMLAAFMWAVAIILSKITLEAIPSNTVFVVQLVAATMVAGTVMMFRRERPGWSRAHLLAYSTGLFEPFLAYTLSLYGLSLVSASIVSVIFATESIMILVLSLLLLGTVIRKPGSVTALILIAFLGVIMVMAPDLRGVTSPSMSGYMAVFAGVFFAALYVVISSRLVHKIAPVTLLTGQVLTCCLLSVPLLLPTVEFGLLTPGIIIMAAIAGTLQYYLAFHFYLVAMKMIPVHLAGMMLYLVPVFSIGLAWLVLGERLSPIQLFGCLVILGAIAILNRQQASDSGNADHTGVGA
ncbi:MAG: DMT family transporter [Rhodobiaceae bacterium]